MAGGIAVDRTTIAHVGRICIFSAFAVVPVAGDFFLQKLHRECVILIKRDAVAFIGGVCVTVHLIRGALPFIREDRFNKLFPYDGLLDFLVAVGAYAGNQIPFLDGSGLNCVTQCLALGLGTSGAALRSLTGGFLPIMAQRVTLGDAAARAGSADLAGSLLPVVGQSLSLGLAALGAGLRRLAGRRLPIMAQTAACQQGQKQDTE